ncbi:putative Ig domain-containing protein [Melioribacter sp. OK-6-Me]|uniref:putative Ig domain-containing protein n=1 Tax=Melioribacter sp. OK-6-Me TaxID=3423433 RepID=UPI003EDB3B89
MRSFKISVVKFLTILAAMLMLGTSTFAQVTVTLPNVGGSTGVVKNGAITVGNLTGLGILSFEFTLSYDKDVVYITGVDQANTLVEGIGSIQVNADTANGKLTVAFANGSALEGQGTLLNLVFKFRNAGTTTLDFGGTFKFNAGTPAVSVVAGQAKTAAVLIQGGSVTATAGDQIKIPVLTTEITDAQNVLSYDFTATFDKNVINITGFELAGTMSEGGSASINAGNGTVTFAFASGNKLTGSGTLVYLVGTAVAEGTTEVEFTSFKFNTGNIPVVADPAVVAVAEANVAPTLTVNPAGPFTVNEGQTLSFQLVGADANTGDVLTYSGTSLPSGASVNATTGVFTWNVNYEQAGNYTLSFSVKDKAGLTATTSVSVTVNNVNRAPVFTAEIPDNEIIPVHNVPVAYEFIYKAEDPDGDAVQFRIVSGPGEISANGEYSWAPTPSQAGKSYVLMVEASDGNLTAVSTKTIKVSDTVTGIEEDGIPRDFKLLQNFPNPFNPTTTIKYAVPKEAHVKLTVYNVLGQEIAVLVNGLKSAGYHTVNFDASNLNTGMYIYKLEAGDFTSVKKMILMK